MESLFQTYSLVTVKKQAPADVPNISSLQKRGKATSCTSRISFSSTGCLPCSIAGRSSYDYQNQRLGHFWIFCRYCYTAVLHRLFLF